ncbi:MAG: glycosyltransferase family 4 protein [Flavobacteriaceae bacterium]|nr:glycosyltransferase family 4 protein [Flavobacteriaceae bacterium]
MKNILFIHQASELYGSDKTLLYLLKSLDKAKFNPVVVLPNEGPLKIEIENENITVVIAPVLKLYRNLFTIKNLIKFIRDFKEGFVQIKHLNKKYNFDVIYSNTLAVLIGYFSAKFLKKQHIWHVHEIIESPNIVSKIFRYLLNRSTNKLVIFNSKATQKFWNIKTKNSVVWNGVDRNNFEYSNDYNLISKLDEDKLKIALIGRISRWKGQQILLDAFSELIKKHKNIMLLFVGSPPPGQEHFLNELVLKIELNRLQESVSVIPFQKDINKIWKQIDIAVVPSTEPEPFGLVAIEAMMASKPVIGSNHGGLKEIIIHNETGFLFTPNDKENLKFYLNELIANSTLRETMGKNGLNRAVKFFSIETYAKSIQNLLSNI